MPTALFLGTFVVLLVLSLAAEAFFLRLGSCWAMIPNVTFGRALWASVAVTLVNLILMAPLSCVPLINLGWAILALGLETVLSLALTWLIIARILRTSMLWAFVAWLPTLIPAMCLGIAVAFVAKFYLFEPFITPQNAMAPAILGRHWEAPCPRCGSPAYCTPEAEQGAPSGRPVLMICSKEHRSCEVANPPHVEHGGDRFFVNKLLQPRRWDIVVFRWPEDPRIKFCMRLVGLPGETVTIRDGAVWIDGKKQTPPDSCQGIEYLDRMKGWPSPLWGSAAQPAKLGPDEYFVLGDFSPMSKDSRLCAGPPAVCRPRFLHRGRRDAHLLAAGTVPSAAVTLNRRSSIQTRSRHRRRAIHLARIPFHRRATRSSLPMSSRPNSVFVRPCRSGRERLPGVLRRPREPNRQLEFHRRSNSSRIPFLQESDIGMILVDRPPQRFVGGDAAKLQVADKGDKHRIVDRAVILRGNLKRRSQ